MAVDFEGPAPESLPALKELLGRLLPFAYPDAVYQQVLASADVSQLAFVDGALAGACVCRLEAHPEQAGSGRCYVVAVAVDPSVRGLGLGSFLVQRSMFSAACCDGIVEAYLHVPDGEEATIMFYERACNLQRAETVEGYYKDSPGMEGRPDAVVMRKPLETPDPFSE